MKILCYFCQQEMESYKVSDTRIYNTCDHCPEICTTIYDDRQFVAAFIRFGYDNREYVAAYRSPDIFYIDECLNTGDYVRVMQLSFCPKNITPYNIKEKFQTLRVWS